MRDTIVIVGGGMMGSGIGAVSAIHGNATLIVDVNLQKAESGVAKAVECIEELSCNGLITDNQACNAIRLLGAAADMEKAFVTAAMVSEAVSENLTLKQGLFEKMDCILPVDIPILSNTSGLRITDIAIKMIHPERAVTAHFWYPAHLVPLVEIVMGEKSCETVAVAVRDEIRLWGKKSVLVRKDLPGQLANRILQAVIREAVNIVETGLASPEDVDTAIKAGMGIRFPVWGPLEHIDAVGLDLCEQVQNTVLPELSSRREAGDLIKSLVKSGNLGYKTGKGIYDWSYKDMEALEKKRNDFIIYALKKGLD